MCTHCVFTVFAQKRKRRRERRRENSRAGLLEKITLSQVRALSLVNAASLRTSVLPSAYFPFPPFLPAGFTPMLHLRGLEASWFEGCRCDPMWRFRPGTSAGEIVKEAFILILSTEGPDVIMHLTRPSSHGEGRRSESRDERRGPRRPWHPVYPCTFLICSPYGQIQPKILTHTDHKWVT